MAKKTRAHNKSKEEIIADLKNNADFQRRMAFTREKFWPALCNVGMSIEDASIWLSNFNTMLMQEFLSRMKTVSMKEMAVASKLDVMADDYTKYRDVIELFDEMDVFSAKDAIEGMRNEIALFKQDEDKSRKLSDLKTKWIDEL